MREIQVTKYVAFDGKEFDNQEMCITYERERSSKSADEFEKIPSAEDDACGIGFTYRYCQDDRFRVVRVRNLQDVITINDYLTSHSCPDTLLTENDTGTVQIFWMWDCEVGRIGTPKEWKEQISQEIDEWFKKMMEDINKSGKEN